MKFTLKIATAAILVASATGAFAQKGETVKIAWLDPLSGLMAAVGTNQLKTFQFLTEEFNKKNAAGVKFEIMPVDAMGNTSADFYVSTSWDDPPMTRGLNLALPAGTGVEWKCTYDVPAGSCGDPNDSCCYTFGGKVESQENCNAFVYYYPKIQDYSCF